MGGSSSSQPSGTCQAVDVNIPGAAKESWWAAIALSGKLYAIPCNADRLLVYDPETSTVSSAQSALAVVGSGKWRSAVASGSKIVCIPDRAEKLLVYDVVTGRAAFVETRSMGTGPVKWQSAFLLGGKVYGLPFNADRLLVYDVDSGKVSGVWTTGVAQGQAKWLAGAVLNGKLYGIPASASSILVYDPISQKASGIDVSHLAGGISGKLKWLSAVAVGGKLYGIPCHAECILVYDPLTGTATGIDTTSIATGEGKWMSVVAQGGKLYGIPDHADSILVFDPVSGAVSSVSVTHIAEGPFKWQAGVAMSGKIYAAPFNADSLLIFDPLSSEATSVDTSSIAACAGKWSTTVALNGCIYGIPWNAGRLLSYAPASECPKPEPSVTVSESTNVDKLDRMVAEDAEQVVDLPEELRDSLHEDFIAAWLSDWIYYVEDQLHPPPIPALTIGGIAVDFGIVAVHEEPLQGSPARLAVVRAKLPRLNELLFFVLKGTSYITDFVANANISPDYAPFNRHFRDRTTFVHHGAHHAITQLHIHQRDALDAIVRQCASEGIEKLIVTGHSLGGQYAMAFLLEVFLDISAQVDMLCPLWTGARCVTFGSPMTFGSAEGSSVRKDLAEFFRSRSTNYINGGDPCARLWSEIDIEGFVRFLAERFRSQIPGALRPLVDWAVGPGGMAQKAEELLQRPDIDAQLLRPAQRYVHVSNIRLIADCFFAWRPMGQDGIVLEDHSIKTGYLAAFQDALDKGSSKAVYAEDGSLLT